MWISLLALALAEEPLEDPQVVHEHAHSTVLAPSHTTLIWQGFDHTWLRRALGIFALPHRVSLFRSRPLQEVHVESQGGVHSSVLWQFGQSTGVDGDYMEPQAHVARLYAPDVAMYRGRLHFSTVDQIADRRSPRALARFNDGLRIPASSDFEGHAVALVRGLSFRSACMDEPDQCNSDGIWPYRFRVELAPCKRVGSEWMCPATIEVGRAWTPGRGGLKYFEEKPLNERMAIEVDLDWVVLEGEGDALSSSTFVFENALGSNRQITEEEQALPVPVVGDGTYQAAAVGLSSFGFQFYPRRGRKKDANRGRYVAGWNLRVQDRDYDPDAGVFVVGHSGGIWLPQTVKRTGVGIELGITIAQLGHPDASVVEVPPIEGRLCSDSHEAPFFSKWTRCADLSGAEQLEQQVPVEIPTAPRGTEDPPGSAPEP